MRSNPSKLICQETNRMGIVSIEDISGTFPDKDFGWADIIYCSTGSPKILECGYGGFVGISTEINLKESEKVLSFSHLPTSYYEKLYTEVENSNTKLNEIRDIVKIFYQSSLNIPYRDSKSLSIFVKYENPNKLLERLNRIIRPKSGKSLFTKCPRYDRVKENGFVIEAISFME